MSRFLNRLDVNGNAIITGNATVTGALINTTSADFVVQTVSGFGLKLYNGVSNPLYAAFASDGTSLIGMGMASATRATITTNRATLSPDATTGIRIGDTSAATTKLDVVGNAYISGTVTIAGGTPGAGKVLTSTDGTGAATWQTPSGSSTTDKASVLAVQTSNVTLGGAVSGTFQNDGITAPAGGPGSPVFSRWLLVGQTNATQNGIYTIGQQNGPAAYSTTRATDADTQAELPVTTNVWVEQGTNYGDSLWVMTNDTAPTPGTDNIYWKQVGGSAFNNENAFTFMMSG